MLPGPVFQVELLTSARQTRYYVLRVAYTLILLLVIWQSYTSSFGWTATPRNQSIQSLSTFAQSCFMGFAWTQGLTVILLTPTLLAGVIADERQRKTLHYLLASQLTSGEIVLGKMLARFLHLTVVLALGLPIMSLLSLFGGIDPVAILLTYLGTFTTALLIASVSVLISTVSRRVRDAILATYLLGLIWFVVPLLIAEPMRTEWPVIYSILAPVNRVFVASTPMGLIIPGGSATLGTTFGERFAWMVGLQVLFSLAMIGVSVLRLRPSYRNEGARSRWMPRKLASRPTRFWNRPPCGDDPMLWKERHGVRLNTLTRISGFIVWLCMAAGIAYGLYELGEKAIDELLTYGYGFTYDDDGATGINGLVRGLTVLIFIVAGLGVASAAASGVSGEKETDTWISLITTDLTGEEILRGKMIGAVWSLRPFLSLILVLMLIGLVLGGLHPFGFLLVLVEIAVYLWFATALGTYFSLVCRNSTRALIWTVGTLIFLNGGYLIIALMFYDDSPAIALGSTPFVIAWSLVSYGDVWDIVGFHTGRWWNAWNSVERMAMLIATAVSLAGYAAAATVLTLWIFHRFDVLIDRPRRSTVPNTLGTAVEAV